MASFDTNFFNKNFTREAKYAVLSSLVCWLVFGLLLEDIAVSALMGAICFFPLLLLLLLLPKMKKRKHAAIVEAEMPFYLLNIAVELNLGVSFVKALEHAAKGRDECAKEIIAIVREIKEQGASVQDALRHFSERIESQQCKRAAMQLAASFEQHGKNAAEPIKKIALEMLTRQRLESKLFSGKLVVLSLLFIAVSAIVPALFQSFSIVGSVVLQMSFTAEQLFLIIVAGFPLLDLAVLFYIKAKTPVFLQG